ncbi:MAG TPA: outer membrane protein transport protein, partial [Micropepsaceae bacterium]|nr:outer membrane protein transport protein [Micropepsaceae bacterium]
MVFSVAYASHPALAAGFLNNMQSTGAASVSTAGQTAIAEDAATVYYNPAGMTLLHGPEILISSGFVFMSNDFKNGGTTAPLGDPARGSSGNNDQFFAVPSLFATTPLSDRLSVGFGIFNPFGQVNKYADNWVGRYQLQSISLKSIDIDPTIAYRISDAFSIGGGIDIQYAHFKRKSALDFGALCFATIGPANCSGLGLLPQSADGQIAVEAEDWRVGFNLSALYNFGDSTHIGLNYRSEVRHDFSGDADFILPAVAGPLTAGGQFQDTSVRSSVTFPEIIALGLSQKIDDRLTLLVDVDWTRWSRIKQITFNFGNPLQPAQSLLLNWDDSARFSIGGIYHLTDDTDLRAGFAYDQSATSDAFRSADL